MKGHWEAERDPLVALQNGDPGLFEAFVASEVPTFLAFFIHLGADRTDAEDLTQELFVKLYRSAPHYEPRSAFSAYALRVARNAWIDRRRRAGVRPRGASLDDPEAGAALMAGLASPAADALAIASLAEDRRRLVAAVAKLPRAHAAVFELAVVQGQPYADVAAALSIPVGTVKSRVFNCLRKLRALLEEGDDSQ